MKYWTRQLRSNPERGVSELIETHGGLVYFTVRRLLKGYPDDDIEECVSDVFLYVYNHRDRLDLDENALKSYLVKTAAHRTLDHQRKIARIPTPSEDAVWDASAADQSAEELAIARIEREELIDAVLSLGDPDATILIAKYFIGLKGAEIAAMLRMKENTVVTRAARALRRLRIMLKGAKTNA